MGGSFPDFISGTKKSLNDGAACRGVRSLPHGDPPPGEITSVCGAHARRSSSRCDASGRVPSRLKFLRQVPADLSAQFDGLRRGPRSRRSRPLANPAGRPQDGLCPLPVRLCAEVVAGQPMAARAQRAGVCDGDAHRTQTKPCHEPEAITRTRAAVSLAVRIAVLDTTVTRELNARRTIAAKRAL